MAGLNQLWNGYNYWFGGANPRIDNYRHVNSFRNIPLIGGIYGARADQLADEENTRYFNDLSKNTGINLNDIKYPIRMGLYGNSAWIGSYASAVTRPIMTLHYGNKFFYGSGYHKTSRNWRHDNMYR